MDRKIFGNWNFAEVPSTIVDAKGRCGERSFISLCHHRTKRRFVYLTLHCEIWEQMAARPNSRLCGQIGNICQHRKNPGHHHRDHDQHFLPTFSPFSAAVFSCRCFTRDQCSLLNDFDSPGLQDIHSIINRFQLLRGVSTLVKSLVVFSEKN